MEQIKAHIAVSLDGHTATPDYELEWIKRVEYVAHFFKDIAAIPSLPVFGIAQDVQLYVEELVFCLFYKFNSFTCQTICQVLSLTPLIQSQMALLLSKTSKYILEITFPGNRTSQSGCYFPQSDTRSHYRFPTRADANIGNPCRGHSRLSCYNGLL